jgi:fucose permease
MTKKHGSTSLLLIAYLIIVALALPFGILNIAWTYIQSAFHLSLDSLALLLAFATVGRLITTFNSGRIVARLGLSGALLAGLLLSNVGLVGYMTAPSWPILLIAASVTGLGGGLIDAALNLFVAANYSAGKMNLLHACFGIGLTIGPKLVTTVVVDWQQAWQLSYALVIVAQLVALACVFLTRGRWHIGAAVSSGAPPTQKVPTSATLRLPVVWLTLALVVVYGGAEIGAGQLSSSLMTGARGVDLKTVAYWIANYWGCFTVGRLLSGVIVDTVGARTLLRISMFGAVLAAVMIAANVGNTASFLALAALGFCYSPVFPTTLSETQERLPARHMPNMIGFMVGVGGLGGALLPGLGSVLAQHFGLEAISAYLVIVSFGTFLMHEWIILRDARIVAFSEAQ